MTPHVPRQSGPGVPSPRVRADPLWGRTPVHRGRSTSRCLSSLVPAVSWGPSIGSERKAACAAQPHRHSNRLVLNAAGACQRGAAFQGLLSARQVWGKKAARIGCSAVTQKVLQTPVDSPPELGEGGGWWTGGRAPTLSSGPSPQRAWGSGGGCSRDWGSPTHLPRLLHRRRPSSFPSVTHMHTLPTSTGFRKSTQRGH